MSNSGAGGLESEPLSSIDGEKEKPEVIFDMNGQIIFNRNRFKARCLELAKTNVGLLYDDWRYVPPVRKDDVFRQLQNEFRFPPEQRENILNQMSVQWKTWKKNLRKNHFEVNTEESILAKRGKVPEGVLVTTHDWNTFVEREATAGKLAQREKAKENRSKKKDAHYLGRTSYAEKEATWQGKRKPDRVELYVEARRNPKTNEFHPGAVADLEKINEIRNSQDEGSKGSLGTDALTQHFGKDKKGRTRGVGSTVASTRLKATLPVRSELQKVQAQMESTSDMMGSIRQDLNQIMKYIQEQKASTSTKESGGSHDHAICSEKSFANKSPRTPSSGVGKYYYLKSLDGRKAIAVVMIEKTPVGATVHNRPMLPYEVKVNVIRVLSGMHNEVLWQGTQGGEDTIGGTEGGYLVWPQNLVEEVVGEISI